MAIALAASISEVGGIDQQHLGETFSTHYAQEPWRGYASGPPTVFAQVKEKGIPYSEAAETLYGGEGSFGNGAAMRIAPLGLFYHSSLDLYEEARRSAQVTHTHPIGVDGAAVQARAVSEVVPLDPDTPFPAESFLSSLRETARTPEMKRKLERLRDLWQEGQPSERAARVLGQGVAVQRSLPFAIYTFVRHADDFEACLRAAVLTGGDRDTLGAMACAISGAYLGLHAVPRSWRQKLENREQIERLALRLLDMHRERRD
jgi:poly(ADP-ribose) glycohydrolase ARH3